MKKLVLFFTILLLAIVSSGCRGKGSLEPQKADLQAEVVLWPGLVDTACGGTWR
jgi:hypothetical protein